MTTTVNGIKLGYKIETDEATGKKCVVITDAKNAKGDLAIPSEIDGIPVTSIKDWAFQGCSNLTSITIPDSVTSVVAH